MPSQNFAANIPRLKPGHNRMRMPGHAYVPGLTERHGEDTFDDIRDTARPGMSVAELTECEAFKAGLAYLEAGYFWESHEVLEPVWLACNPAGAERLFVQGLIQLTNARLKLRMGQPKAAARIGEIARKQFEEAAYRCKAGRVLGEDVAGFLKLAREIAQIDDKSAL